MDDKKYPNLNGASSTVTFNFNDPIFYGAIPKGSIINSKLLNTTGTITKALKSSIKGATYDINCGGASDNLVSIIAYPASWGDISMTVNGLGVQWLKTTIDYTSVAPSEIANNGLLSFTP